MDFTLAEIKQLDAGSWFDPRFAGERRRPTWEEAVKAVGAAAGLYPELKSPPLYRARGIDMTSLFAESLRRLGRDGAAGRLIVQSFDDRVLRELARELPAVPRTFLIEATDGARFPEVRDEMRYYLFELGVDAVFTDNPDRFPRDAATRPCGRGISR